MFPIESRWTIVGESYNDGKNKKAKARCVCGTEKIVRLRTLEKGQSLSCGCLAKELKITRATTHGMYGTRIYSVWAHMKDRCTNPNHEAYRWYGGKGIVILWRDFEEFYEWAVANGYADNLTIDRVDSEGNYEPSNCEWVTLQENVRRMHLKQGHKVSI